METSVKSASLPEKHDHVDLSNSHCGLYQQLYVPQFNAPNPNMVELEKLYKKYPKLSKPLFILNFILLFVLLFNIAHKFNSLSWNMDHGCGANEVFLSFGVVSSLLWFGNCFLFGYSLMKKVEIGLRVSYFLLGTQLALTSLACLLRIFEKETSEICELSNGEKSLFGINAGMEIVLILIFMLSAMEMKKVLVNIQILREKILTPMVLELNEA